MYEGLALSKDIQQKFSKVVLYSSSNTGVYHQSKEQKENHINSR
jgi:hypothetical protein